jgi:hypothetical protein
LSFDLAYGEINCFLSIDVHLRSPSNDPLCVQ